MIDKRTSENFDVARAVAILLVVTGHFGTGIALFWVGPTVGLFVFGFSSAYFTSAKYDERLRLGPFWRNKLDRLAPNVLVANAFLVVLLALEGRPGLLTWQSLVHLAGMTGWLNWFGLEIPSPLGAGLWFFTLLLCFYAVYPALRWVGRSRPALGSVVGLALVAAVLLNRYMNMGHALWLTAWSFVLGVFVQRAAVSVRPLVSASVAVGLAAAMLGLNLVWSVKTLNTCLLLAICTCIVLWLKDARLPIRFLRPLRVVSGMLLEVYFVHTYLFVRVTGYAWLDYMVSLACILGASWVLNRVASQIRRLLARSAPAKV
ncbi:MAG TPA: acyltransferase family protein [Phycisphaerae bacterium]|nr:acyltransferase family protein [Phycisphaerae bacterium]